MTVLAYHISPMAVVSVSRLESTGGLPCAHSIHCSLCTRFPTE